MKSLGRFSAEKQKLLRQLLAERGVRASGREPIPLRAASTPGAPPALSFAQQRLWVLDRLEPGSAFYNIPLAVRLAGRLDLPALFGALLGVVRRHEALRTTFGEAGGRPFQVLWPALPPDLGAVDLSALPEVGRAAETARLAAQEAARPFDLEHGPLLRTAVLRLRHDEHVALVTMHHIVSDGWSFGVFLRETAALYEAALRALPPPLPPLPIQYADFAAWQRSWLSGPVLAEQLGWWRERLAGAPAALDLPADRPRPAVPSSRGARRPVTVPPALADRLRDLCRSEDATLFMALLAAFATVLGRAAGQSDLVLGTPIANRNREEIEGLIGFFVNTLALRVDLTGAPGFRALLGQVRQTAHGAYAHQDLPFERLVEEIAPEREAGRNPLFQVMFALQNTPVPTLEVADLVLVPLPTETGTAKFDLSLYLQEVGGVLGGDLEYSTDLFDGTTVDRLIGRLERFLEAALADLEAPVTELPLLHDAERHQVLVEWNDTASAVGAEPDLLHELFEAQAGRTPEAVALISGAERWTYQELEERAETVAAELRALGVGAEDRVAISMPRTPWMIAGMLGILKAGGAYVPVDPVYPEGRRAAIVADAEVVGALTPRPPLPPPHPTSPGEGETGIEFAGAEGFPPRPGRGKGGSGEGGQGGEGSGGGLAYLIYTSGSTGTPKGVAVSHASAVALVRWALEVFSPAELSRVLAATSINFDLSVFEIFVPLSMGGAVVLAEDALALPRLPAAGEVTLINTVPSAMTELVRAGAVPASVETINLAGEPLPRELVEALYRIPTVRRVYDLYGPSEDTTYSTFARMERLDRRAPSIGRPVAGTRVRLLDRAFQVVPIGVPGELCLGGVGLARGYLGRPALTGERWVPDPVPPSGDAGERIYRTGDLARYRTDGMLEFLGRIDHQVKVRGFRIELGEIEETLRGLPGVREAAVLALGEGAERRLAAFVAGDGLVVSELREALRDRLPAHMVPTTFAFLAALPLTPNGKLDRRALSRLETEEARSREGFVAPRGAVEEMVAEIFAEVLGGDRIGATDHFFELGGHSLLAMRALSRVRTALGADLPLRAVFEAPTVETLARRIEAARGAAGEGETPPLRPVPRDREMPLSFAQERMWFMDRLAPGSPIYNVPEVMRLRGPLRPDLLARCLDAMVERHESLRTHFGLARDGRPVQVIDAGLRLTLPLIDLSALPETPRLRETERVVGSEMRRPFDLHRGPVLRAGVVRLAPEDHVTLLARHHIVSDGWSMDLFSWEISVLYQALAEGKPSPLSPLPIQYADFAVWQREQLRGPLLDRQLDYWRQKLAGAPPLLELPTDRPRPPVQTHRGEIRTLRVPEEQARSLRALARRDGGTLFMVLLTAFETWIHRVTGRDDLLIGTPVANRHRPELEMLIGFLANTLVLRTDLAGDPPFREALARVRDVALGAWENQDVPFERVVEELRPKRDLSYTPIFQVMYVQQAIPRELPTEVQTLEEGKVGGVEALARFDFELYAIETLHGVELAAEYNVGLFDRVRVDRTLGHLKTLLDAVLTDPEQRLSALPLLTAPERHQLLVEWIGDAAEPAGDGERLHELFEAQVARTPEALALIAEEERWTYRELDERAEAIAAGLRAKGVGAEDRVAVSLPRTVEMVAALFGVLKAGGVYVPVDPGYPVARRAAIVADAAPVGALTPRPPLPPRHPTSPGEGEIGFNKGGVGFEGFPPRPGRGSGGSGEGGQGGEGRVGELAYLIYTSGSTGEPKGVAIPHASAVALVRWAGTVFSPSDLAGVLASTSINFDLSVFEIFVPLAYGGTVILVENALELLRLPSAGEVTLINTVPSAMSELVRTGGVPASVRVVNLAGEPLTRELAERILELPHIDRLYNLYGPSEDTTYSTFARVRLGDRRAPAIGRPVAGSRVMVVDRRLQPVALGVPGELCLAGAGLARGYLGRAAATAEKWVPDPFSGRSGERMYRTGDLVRWRAEGELEFLGRIDHQVKVRGFRIEPGEIEAALRAFPGVEEAVVAAWADSGEGRLVAWVAGADPAALEPAELRRFLRERLPEALIPSFFVPLADLPRTATGKIDRAALPAPGITREEKAAWEAPRGPLEQLIADLWTEVLGTSGIGAHDDFFDLGGHSLLATQYVSRLRDALGIDLPVRAVFEAPTVAGQARRALAGRLSLNGSIAGGGTAGEAPLSFAQERMWFLDRLAPEGAYHIPAAVRLRGDLRPEVLEGALREIVRRQEALRTVFVETGDGPVQRVVPDLPELARIDLSALPETAREIELLRAADVLAALPFDLVRGPVLRFTLFRLAPEDHALAITMHHIVSDGWSIGVFVGELAALYPALAVGLPSPLPALPVQYADWARWQRERLDGAGLGAEIAWWRGRLGEDLPVLELPADRPRPPAPSFRGGSLDVSIPAELTARVRSLGREWKASLFMTLLGAFQLLLHRLSGQETVVVGTPVAGRDRTEVEGLVGLFVNTLALRSDLPGDGETGFGAWIEEVRGRVLDAWMHQEVPFERLVGELQPRRSLAHAPLFQALLALQNAPLPPLALPGLRLEPLEVETGRAPFDLTVAFAEGGETLLGSWTYARDLFDAPSVTRWAGCLAMLLDGATTDPERPVLDLPLLSAAERATLLRTSEGSSQEPRSERLDELFAAQARRTPEAMAISTAGREITYAELDEHSDRLAARLVELGVGPEVPVGLCAERSPELITGMLAILKAGGAYLPLDPAHPKERLAFMLRDAGAGIVLADPDLDPSLLPAGLLLLSLGGGGWSRGEVRRGAAPDTTAAYVIYTSGSTGQPKGVLVPHRAVARLVLDTDYVHLGPTDRVAQIANTSFDAATFEVWGALLTGARLVILPRDVTLEPRGLAEALRREGITALFLTTALFQQVAREEPAAFASVRHVLFGGETVDPRGARAVLAAGGPQHLLHVYGPTEATTFATWHRVEDIPEGARTIPIGQALAGACAFVLDPRGEPVPPGVAGELFVGGEGLARGYLGQPERTAERFVPSPFGPPGARLYRTGDRVRRRSGDGALEFLGRFDDQVKIRGFRVEPGEIEAVLAAHPDVTQAVVLVREEGGERRLVACVAVREPAPPVAALRAFLRERLPEPMVPAEIVLLGELPLTANGKVDRAVLSRLAPQVEREAPEAPRTPAEELLAVLWSDLLGVERPAPRDGFFDLGGHSLLAARLVARVREVFGIELPVRAVFEEPSLGALAAHIEALHRAGALAAPPIRRGEGPAPLSFAQQRLWFLDRLTPGRAAYNIPAALRLRGALDPAAVESALHEIQRRHEALRTTFDGSGEEPVAVVAPEPLGRLERFDVAAGEVDAWLAAEAARPFDLERGPLVRSALLRIAPEEHVLALTVHHIVADGWSMGVLIRELTELYTAAREARPAVLPDLPVQAGDVARRQRGYLCGEALAAEIAHWRERLAGAPGLLDLPVDRPWSPAPGDRGGQHVFALGANLSAALRTLVRREAVTPFMLLLTGFAALLARWCGQDDLLLGVPVAGRDRRETESVVGLLVNTLVLRVDLRGEPSLREALRRVRETALDAFAHPDFPFEKLVEELQPERSLARPPLVQATFALQNLPPSEIRLPGLDAEPLAADSGAVKVELALTMVETDEGFAGTLSYATDLFERATIERLAGGFAVLLGEMSTADPGEPLPGAPEGGERPSRRSGSGSCIY